MKRTAFTIKNQLLTIMKNMAKHPWLFARNPEKDFTRKRKLPFEEMLLLLLGMESGSLRSEMLKFTKFSPNTASTAALIQQREKLEPFAFEYILQKFMPPSGLLKQHKGYRLLAVDGSDLHTPTNSDETKCFFRQTAKNPESKGYNLVHLNAIYDLMNGIYVDALLQNRREFNENKALVTMVDRSPISGKTIIIADRGFECYNSFAHIEEKGWNYLVRVKDIISGYGMLSALDLPDEPEFDVMVNLILTRRQTALVKENPRKYRFLPSNANFDFCDLNTSYPISFRVVRFPISDGIYESVITNLDQNEFTLQDIKALYNMRWGIETSFRALKHAVGLLHFHSKKSRFIAQEVFAALIFYNFSAFICDCTDIPIKNSKYEYQINFSAAIFACRQFFRGLIRQPDLATLISANTLPVRKGRSFPRVVRCRTAVAFNYRP